MSAGGAVLIRRVGPVLEVTLNRPEVRNAIDDALSHGVADALALLDQDDDLRVAVLTGAGSTFCSGMDLRAWEGRPAHESTAALDRLVRHGARKPVIAAIEGFAVGGGLELALACDLIVAARDARVGIPEVRRSLVPSGGALLRLPGRVPAPVAVEMALTGVMLSGERLHTLGLVSRLADHRGALTLAHELGVEIAACGPLAVVASKGLLASVAAGEADPAWERQAAVCSEVNTSDDAAEGIRAFLEKRPPRFRGR